MLLHSYGVYSANDAVGADAESRLRAPLFRVIDSILLLTYTLLKRTMLMRQRAIYGAQRSAARCACALFSDSARLPRGALLSDAIII